VDDEFIDGSTVHGRSAYDPAAPAFSGNSAAAPALPSSGDKLLPVVRLFDPNRLLAVLAVLFWPLKFFPILLIPAVLLAGLTAFKHWDDVTADLQRLLGEYSLIVRLLLGLLVVNLTVRLATGAVVRAFGGAVRSFGLVFFLGIIPRFHVDRGAIRRLDRNAQLWVYGASLVVRLSFFAFGMLVWATYRSSGTWVANLALLFSQTGLWTFLFAVMPLLPGDGYNWFAAYFRQPILRQRAFLALNAKLRGRRLPPSIRSSQVPMLIAFAVGSILAIVALAAFVLIALGMFFIKTLQGLGAAIFLALVASLAMWLISLRTRARRQDRSRDIRLLQAAMAARADAAEPHRPPSPRRRSRRLMICAAAAVILIVVAFLPYSYYPAGPFEILPSKRSEAVAQIDGEVVDVMVREGDWVSDGQVLAYLSSVDQQRDVSLTREQLERAEARLAQLDSKKPNLDQAAPGDVEREAARNEVERLRQQLQHDETELQRTTIRAPAAGVVTTPDPQFLTGVWLNAGDKFLQIDDTKVVEAEIEIPQGDIGLIKPGAMVQLRPWSERDREIFGHVIAVAATASGTTDENVTGMDESTQKTARLLRRRMVKNESAPNALDRTNNVFMGMDEPALGVDALPHRAMARDELAPAAGDKTAIDVGRVTASVPNGGMLLRPGMSGYAKIAGADMTVGEAYLRLCIRFFAVELWSWVP
jgi:multidrug efflux pump subunit AcrA (membrane-fusion protein)